MIKNYKNIDSGNRLKEKIILVEDSQLTRDQHLLNSVVGLNYMDSHKIERIRNNEVRWRTGDLGVQIETSNLSGDPYIIPFDNEEVIGDRAKSLINTYWYFQAGIAGLYRMSTNCRFELFLADESTVKTIFDNYIPQIDEAVFGFYRNDAILQTGRHIPISTWNPYNNDYYINHNRTTYRFFMNQDIIYYLDAGDKIDVRAGFTQYIGTSGLFLTTWGDVNINFISENNNYNRLT